jgi:succinate dehydrogenase / fumarate reductase, flavoprotein subunit
VDITKEAMEVGPTLHYVMGGVKVDPETQAATVPGLFTAGEVTGGMHGANRLGGNSLSDLLVFGRRAGWGAAEFAKKQRLLSPPENAVQQVITEALAPFDRALGENAFQIQVDLQMTMQANAGIVRDQAGLEAALAAVETLRQRTAKVGVVGSREYNPGWNTAMDLKSLLTISEAVARAALTRTESRGAHTRLDYPDSDPEQERVQYVIKKEGERMVVRPEKQPDLPPELATIIKAGG